MAPGPHWAPTDAAAALQRWQFKMQNLKFKNMLLVVDTDKIQLALRLMPRVGAELYHFPISSKEVHPDGAAARLTCST
jgi:hypothetical protein